MADGISWYMHWAHDYEEPEDMWDGEDDFEAEERHGLLMGGEKCETIVSVK